MNTMESDPLFAGCLELARGMARHGLSGYGKEMGELLTGMMQPEPPTLDNVPPRVRELAEKICRSPHAHEVLRVFTENIENVEEVSHYVKKC